MTVERNSNIKYTSPAIHGQKGKGQQTLPPLPNTLPSQVQVKLSDYAPLENPEKALALAMRLKEIQERGEEVLLITRNEELEELNRMRETTTDREQEEWAIAAPLVIPEIDELERRLAGASEDDVDGKRVVIREWIRGLHGTGSLKPLDEKGRTRRRYINEVAAEEIAVCMWVDRLTIAFESLAGNTIHISQAERDYNIANPIISNWKRQGFLQEVEREKNRIHISDKAIAIAATINKRFGRPGTNLIKAAMTHYNSLN